MTTPRPTTILRYRHVIWDWNGTLLDDVEICLEVLNTLLARRGLAPIDRERYRTIFDFPVIDFYRQLGFDFQTESFETVADEYIAGYREQLSRCRLHDGAAEVVARLDKAGVSQSVLSAYHQKRLEEAVTHFGLSRYFIKLVGLGDYYAHSKIEAGQRWIKELHHNKNDILLIGDTVHDAEVADSLGIRCVLLSCGHQKHVRLESCGVSLYNSFTELGNDIQEAG